MIALVTGATGCIGHTLVSRLIKSGDYSEVRALVRWGNAADMPPGVCVISGDLDDTNALQNAARNVDVVFHCAAKVHDALGKAADFFRVNVDGTQHLLDACVAQNQAAPRFVFFSTVAVFGDTTPPEGINENAPALPQTPYAQSKLAAEQSVFAGGEAYAMPVSVLRVATVYGPRDRGNLARMMAAIAQNKFVMMGSGHNRKTCANVENVVSAAIAASHQANSVGTPITVADPAPYSLQELHQAMRDALAAEGWIFEPRRLPSALPVPLALAASTGVTGAARLFRRKSPLTPVQVRRLAANNVYQIKGLNEVPGYFPASNLSEGMREAARWLIAEGKIKETKKRSEL